MRICYYSILRASYTNTGFCSKSIRQRQLERSCLCLRSRLPHATRFHPHRMLFVEYSRSFTNRSCSRFQQSRQASRLAHRQDKPAKKHLYRPHDDQSSIPIVPRSLQQSRRIACPCHRNISAAPSRTQSGLTAFVSSFCWRAYSSP